MGNRDIKYPEVIVKNFGRDGNTMALVGECKKAAKEAGISPKLIGEFIDEALSGDYDHVLQTCIKWFDVRHYSEAQYEN